MKLLIILIGDEPDVGVLFRQHFRARWRHGALVR